MRPRTMVLACVGIVSTTVSMGVAEGDVQRTIVSPPLIADQLYFFGPGLNAIGGTADLDLNGDGTPDLTFTNRVIPQAGTFAGMLIYVTPSSGVQVLQENLPHNQVGLANVPAGTLIGPASNLFIPGNSVIANGVGPASLDQFPYVDSSNWHDAPGYLGFSIIENGQTHYGWLSMHLGALQPRTVSQVMSGYSDAPDGLGVDSFAIESSPDTAIAAGVVPEPGAIGIFLLTAIGLLRRRRASPPANKVR